MPREDAEERLNFYSEMIDDRMEEGLTEEEAVAAAGDLDEIAADMPPVKIAKEKSGRRLAVWEIVLLILGAPLWFSLGIAVVAVIFSLYISLWAVIVSLWAVDVVLVVCAVALGVAGIVFAIDSNVLTGIAVIAAGIVLVGLSVFAFWGCLLATKGVLFLTKKAAVWVKNCFAKKKEVR